ncbi:tetratricopeptide repeat protein [Actinokineospora guangxiensis]|uniref:Tetratricopeptide repeat protein n=1 Tax=Actinokineospora guangxiensis TaxID=1490288 RepID=A0ABW0EQ95_9PSEU
MAGRAAYIGEVLRAHRLRARLTQQELAERSGVSVRALRYIERGSVGRPRPDSVRRLAAAVGVDPEELTRRAGAGEQPSARLSVKVLGELRVQQGGDDVELGAFKQRTLLGLLALRANQPVRREEIVDVLWGERPPDSCHGLVHTYISRLRRALVSASRRNRTAIASVPGGYLLAVPDQVDAVAFDDLVTRAEARAHTDPAAALGLYDRALGLWRGAVLADLGSRLRGHPSAVALTIRRRQAALAHADLAMALGSPAQAVERVRPLVRDEPLHEGLHARLILALAGTGEQAAALRVFADLRARLGDELGVEPGAEVRAAHLRVLRASEPGPAAQRAPAQLPPDPPGFVGRAAAVARLGALLPAPDRQASPVVAVVSGAAGVGKTALAVHWAHRVRDRFPDGQLSVDLRGYASRTPPSTHEVLVRFLHALGVPPERVPVDGDEAIGLYRTMLAGKRVLVLLDNAAAAEQVRPLLPGAPGCFVVVTSRDRLTGLTARDGAHSVPLDVLAPAESVDLLGGLLGAGRARREARAAAELADTCGHLPLALRIAGANLAVRPGDSVADHTRELRARGRLSGLAVAGDESAAVRAAFDLSYDKLVPPARRLFRLLGLVPGVDVDLAATAALAGLAPAATTRLVGVLVQGNLIRESAAGRHAFHDLLREYARSRAEDEDTARERISALERLFDHYIDEIRAHSAVLWQTGAHTDAMPGTESSALAWLDEERANLVAATVAAPEIGLPAHSWRFAEAMRGYFANRGGGADGVVAAAAALTAARAEGDVDAEASVHDLLGLVHCNLSDYASAVEHHRWALELSRGTGNRVVEAAALHNLGRAYSQLGQPAQAEAYYEEALSINRAIGNRRGEAAALHYTGAVALSLGRPEAAIERHQEALELSTSIDHRQVQGAAAQGLGLAYWALGDLRRAAECYERALAVCRRYGYRHGEVAMLICLAETGLDKGEFTESAAGVRVALDLARQLGERRHEVSALDVLATIQQRTGEWSEAARHYQEALALAREIRFGYGEASVLTGLCVLSRRTGDLESSIRDGMAALALMRDTGMRLLEGRALTELAHGFLDAGEVTAAADFAEQSLAVTERAGQRLARGRARHVRALVRQVSGDLPGAVADWRAALVVFAELAVPEEAHVRALLAAFARP